MYKGFIRDISDQLFKNSSGSFLGAAAVIGLSSASQIAKALLSGQTPRGRFRGNEKLLTACLLEQGRAIIDAMAGCAP